MARKLVLFSASRTTTYRNTHRVVPRRLQTTGQGTRRVTRMANRVTGGQSLRANGGQLMRSLKYDRRHATATRYTLLRFRNAKMKRGSFGSSGG